MQKFNTYSADEKRTRKANGRTRKQSIKLATEIKEVRNDKDYLKSLFGEKSTARS